MPHRSLIFVNAAVFARFDRARRVINIEVTIQVFMGAVGART